MPIGLGLFRPSGVVLEVGQPLLSGMVIDESDIEIGTGISSKAMSKKMPTNSALKWSKI